MLYFHKFSERHEVYNEKIRERGFSFTNTVSISSTFDLAFSSQLQNNAFYDDDDYSFVIGSGVPAISKWSPLRRRECNRRGVRHC